MKRNTLDEWEAEAKEDLNRVSDLLWPQRCLILIELVRKKDEALRFYDGTFPPRFGPDGFWEIHISPGMGGEDRFGTRAKEALALTEKMT